MRLIKYIAFIIILFTALLSHAAVNVTEGHPRIWFTSGELSTIVTNCEAGGDLRDHYLELRDWLDGTSLSANAATAWHIQRYWIASILSSLVEGGSYLTALKADIAAEYALRESTVMYSPYRAAPIALAYDWMYSTLNSTDLGYIADIFVKWWDYWYGPSGDFHSTANNHTHEEVQQVVFGAVALDGDGYCDTEAATALTRAESWMDEYMSMYGLIGGNTSSLGSDGGYNEGMEYFGRGGYALIGTFKAWDTGTDDSITQEWLDGLGKWALHMYRNDSTPIRSSDIDAWTVSGITSEIVQQTVYYMLSGFYADDDARYLWDEAAGDSGVLDGASGEFSDGYDYIYSFYIIFYNSTAAITIGNEDKSVLFDGLDEVMIRKGWTTSDNFFHYKHSDMFSGHEHFDASHFSISRDVGLAVDAGAYGGGDNWYDPAHEWEYYQRTLAHNCLTVYDSGESWAGTDWDNNDGGHEWPDDTLTGNWQHYPDAYSDIAGGLYDQGGITRWYDSATANYIRGDVQPAFSSKVTFYFREFIIPNQGDYYIVCDKVTASNSAYTKRWLLHAEVDPAVSGDSVEIDNGSSDLLIEFVLPTAVTITERGGSGSEYYTTYDGAGDNPQPYNSNGESSPNENGLWRLEVSPDSAATNDTFLVVMKAGADAISMPTINSLAGTGYIGVHIEDSSENQIAIFNSAYSATDNTTITYTVTPTTGSRHIISGLDESRSYTVNGSGDYNSGASGVIEFTDTTTSETEYVITLSGGDGYGISHSGAGTVTCSGSGTVNFN